MADDQHNFPTFMPRLKRWDRPTASVALTAGAGVIALPRLAQRELAEIEMVAVSGPSIGGARVSLYRNDETVPGNFMGTGLLSATDPGVTFVAARPWLYGLEQLLVVVTGAGGSSATATSFQRLYADEYCRPPAQLLEPADPVEVPPGGESDL